MGNQMIYDSIIFKTMLTIAVLMSVFFVSFPIGRWSRAFRPVTRQILIGFYFGLAADLLIWFNFFLRSSDLIDAKLMMTGIIATWYGIIPAVIVLVMVVAGALAAYGFNFAIGILILALASCVAIGYILNRVGKSDKRSQKARRFLNFSFGIILSFQAIFWKYILTNLSGVSISLLDSGLHKAVFFMLISYSVGLILMSEHEIEAKTRDLEKANNELNTANEDLNSQKEGMQAAYQQLEASEQQLMAQNEELQTAYERIETSEEEFEALFNAGNEAIWKRDPETGEKKYSDKVFEMFGFHPQETEEFEASRKQRRHPEDAAMVNEYEQNLIAGKIDHYVIDYRTRHRDGHYIWVRNKATRLIYKNGKDMGLVGSLLDISEIKEYENRILDMAYTDSLTGLPNRRAFIERFEEILESDCEEISNGVMFFVDTDNFKYINDVMGHNVGDDILRETGSRLSVLRDKENCFVSRVGGDEFIIIHYGRHGEKEIENMAKEISEAFATPYMLNGRKLYLTISTGITVYPDDGRTVGRLIKNADIAMYKAKKKGKDGWCLFESWLEEEASQRMQLESHLRKAVANRELILYYQPQVNIFENRVVGYEALVRWNSPEFGMISPGRFIPVAEDTGIIIQLGKWILEDACLFSKELNRFNSGERKYISVNISPLQIMHTDFLKMVDTAISETGIEPDMLGIEITETALLESFGTVLEKVDNLMKKGVHISLDDFGMGFSSLNHLRTLPINTVKIDKSFIDDMSMDERSRILTEEIIRLSHMLGVSVIAEGVEQESQVEQLKELGCDAIQGYFFSRPITMEEALRFRLGE